MILLLTRYKPNTVAKGTNKRNLGTVAVATEEATDGPHRESPL